VFLTEKLLLLLPLPLLPGTTALSLVANGEREMQRLTGAFFAAYFLYTSSVFI